MSVKWSHYVYHTTLSSHEFAGFNVLTDSVDKSSPAFFGFMLLFVRLQNFTEEFNCNILQLDNVSYRLSISNILNCEPFRESEIAKVDYFG